VSCGTTLEAVSLLAPGPRIPAASLVVGSIGLFIWGLGSFPWVISPNLYQHNIVEKLTYFAWGVGPTLIAIGLLLAGSSASEKIGKASVSLWIIGLFMIGVSQFPSVVNPYATVEFRVDYAGPAIGYILLGIGVVTAIPMVAKR
jgi:hypothetical protein